MATEAYVRGRESSETLAPDRHQLSLQTSAGFRLPPAPPEAEAEAGSYRVWHEGQRGVGRAWYLYGPCPELCDLEIFHLPKPQWSHL